MIDDVLQDFTQKSIKTIEAFTNKLSTFRTGRAAPSLVENLMVESYGTKMALKSVASISIPEPKMILLQVWDRTNIPAVEKAIHTSDLGLSPQTEDDLIRVIIPALTGERRDEYKKLVKQEAEKSRIAIRGHRRESVDMFKELKDAKELSEDEEKRARDLLQDEVDKQINEVEVLLENKLEALDQV